MAAPRVLILRAPGTNCDAETEHAFQTAGAKAERVHINRLLENPNLPDEFQILCFPGGFSYGDDIAAGSILAGQIRHHLAQALNEFKTAGKLILGICNGFQVLMKSGVFSAESTLDGSPATLSWNDSRKFEDRWVYLKVDNQQSVFLQGIDSMYLPVAHAEGKFVAKDEAALSDLENNGQLVLRYSQGPANSNGHVTYPENPNGSVADVAGMCDPSGRVFGLMPHPERHIDPTHHPRWTRGEAGEHGDGLKIFENAVQFFS